ncbi:MAG TPA: hypothetical protein VGR73_12325 [Bryobacteraceae bacterium]|nr:hypothetical protein [Bryobacteraceae bacterium]
MRLCRPATLKRFQSLVNLGKFFADHWGDLASVVGLVIVIWASLSAKNAAEQARGAARQVKDRIATLDTLADVSAALAIMEEIKRLQRAGAWQVALDRYSTLRRHLVRIEQINPALTGAQRQNVARSIVQLRTVEAKVESGISAGAADLNLADVNLVVSREIDRMERVMIAIKQAGS